MDNVGIVVEDLDEAVAFFVELGMEVEGRQPISGPFADACVGLSGIECEVAMMAIPGAPGKLELCQYAAPTAIPAPPPVPNTIGFHRVMFAVDDIRDVVDRLAAHGGEVLGEIANYEDVFLLCYLRGPSGVVIGLAEEITR